MTEKKVFKNVAGVTGGHYERRVYLLEGEASEDQWAEDPFTYDPSEWDLEVTLTRKAPKLEVGGTALTVEGDQVAIMGINGSWIWVAEDPEDSGWITDVINLKNVKPWQPA